MYTHVLVKADNLTNIFQILRKNIALKLKTEMTDKNMNEIFIFLTRNLSWIYWSMPFSLLLVQGINDHPPKIPINGAARTKRSMREKKDDFTMSGLFYL